MVYDTFDNIEIYKGLSEDIYEGLKFLKQATPGLSSGIHEINPRVKAIVSEYETKAISEYGYEAHKKFIDIQYLLKGSEKVCCLPIEQLKEMKSYSEENDAAFYAVLAHQTSDLSHQTSSVRPQEVTIGNSFFAIFYPQDGHMPQLCVNTPETVKKVVIKVKI